METRKGKPHKVYHKTNPDSLPNPFNWESRIKLLDRSGVFLDKISQISAFRLMKADAADLVLVNEPTVQLKIPSEEWQDVARGAPDTQTKMLNWLHARRTILYGNFHIQSPTGDLMFHCNNQKALWYLNRDLVYFVCEDPPTLRFKFAPGGPGHVGDEYYLTPKVNRCVVCGGEQGLNRHHVVPRCYRKYMGMEIKSHSYHDVLLMCLDCHEKYELSANELKKALAEEYNCPLHGFYNRDTGEPMEHTFNRDMGHAVKAAIALVRAGDRIPAPRRLELMTRISEMTGSMPTEDDVVKMAQKGWQMGSGHKPGFIDHGEYVVRQLRSVEAVQKFAERWRTHFLEVMQPQHLPPMWETSKPILPEDFEPEGGSAGLLDERRHKRAK